MTRLPRSKKTSQVSFTAHRFNPATCTDRVITIENRSGFKHLRKLELTREDRETIEKMRWRAKNLDPEVVESIVNKFIREKLRPWTPREEGREAEVKEPGPEGGIKERHDFPDGYSAHQAGVSISKPESKPEKKERGGDDLPGKKAQVIPFPKRHKTPRDLVKLLKTEGVKKSSVVLFRAQHKASWWSNSSKLWVWHQKRHKDGRWFTGGIAKLMDMTGLSEMTVKRGLAELKAIGVIFERAHGRKGVTNTIWELALDKRHVNAEKRKPKKPKK